MNTKEYKSNPNHKKINMKKSQRIDRRIWSHKRNMKGLDLFIELNRKSLMCDRAYELLFDNDNGLNNNLNDNLGLKKIKKKSLYLQPISNKCEKLLNTMYSKINFMKNETKELDKLNCISFQKTSKNYFRSNRPKSNLVYSNSKNNHKRVQTASTYYHNQQSLNLSEKNYNIRTSMNKKINDLSNSMSNYEQSKINTGCVTESNNYVKISSKFDNKSINTFRKRSSNIKSNKIEKKTNLNLKDIFEDKEEEKFRKLQNIDIQKLYKNKKKNVNLSRLNDNYRIQINKSLGKYNVENHLKELNKIQLDDMSLRKEMEDFKFKINEEINDCCTGKFYKKEYEKLKNFNKTQQNINIFSDESLNFPDEIPFHILVNPDKENTKVFPNGYKIRALYEFKKDQNKANSTKKLKSENNLRADSFNKDLLLIENVLKKLKNSLNTEPIRKYIDAVKNEKSYNDKNALSERKKIYFPCFNEANKYLHKLYIKKKSSKQNSIIPTKMQEKVEVWKKIQEITKQIKDINRIDKTNEKNNAN